MSVQEQAQNSRLVQLYLEANPNPNSLKFVANFMLVPQGESYDFPTKESAADSPLAKVLFDLPYVERVFFASNFVTVTKAESEEWAEVQNVIKEEIKTYLSTGKAVIDPAAASALPQEGEDSEIVAKIKGILDEYIKPAVEQDGGAITFHSFEGGVVKVLLQGSCSGCPSSTVTLKAGIENLLKRMVPEVESVEAEGV
ncbi:NifU family protein [Aureibacter tunicatorum]|uniref:Fe-S cluster biogenesis protein NfuA n=1 Tax=Aureibacter tunicatorum TaxID=866807 RepID=A0AAE4BRI2_9BACT|nr:NifU family protein [Aureibacter tunicatorum]MDR6238691.1 Fe-S cluster biogenesis protein NfuA [Aureibacter tunicatorum]BDD05378.1 iron transporter [Aureibacter tunicatorum]